MRVPFRRRSKENEVGAWDQWKILPEVLPYLRPYRRLVVVSLGLTVAAAAVGLAEPWPLALVIDDVIGGTNPPSVLEPLFGDNPDPYRLLLFIVGFGFLISTASHGVRVIGDYVNAKIEQNIILDLRSDLFNHVTQLSLTYHDERHTGMLMGLINSQASSLGAIVMSFPPIFESVLMLIGMLAIALLIDWQVTLVSLVCVPFIYWAIGLYGTRIVPRIQRVQSLELRSLSIVFEAMTMLRVITSFGRRRLEHYRFLTQGKTAVDARVRLTVHQTMFSLGVATAIALGTAIVLGFGTYHVLEGYISLGELIVLISYIAAVYQPLESISTTIGSLHQSFVFLNASFSILAEKPEVIEKEDAIDIGRSSGAITFENVSFAYKGRQGTIRNVSFSCKGGERVAVVGPTGAGKTTLMNLLVRFYDPAEGSICLDGYDTKDLTLDCLREQMSLVMQTPLLFSGSIADNIRYGKLTATMDDIVGAAKEANCHDFISSLPSGYQTELGEGGAQLSGGERQRIAVARAFIRAAPVLILDEPTSAIDSKTEAVILDALENLMEGRTSFMIAHRLSTVRNADLILVLNHGEVVEQGTHEELLARNGLYYQLYEAQTGRAAAIEAQYAQEALAAGDSKLGVSDILAEVATAEALARYERMIPGPEEPREPDGNGAEPAAQPGHGSELRAPRVPQPSPHSAAPQSPAPAPDGQVDVSEQVIAALTDAVRQRIREALSTSASTGTAAERREHRRVDTGDTVLNGGTEGSNDARDQDGPGPDPRAPRRFRREMTPASNNRGSAHLKSSASRLRRSPEHSGSAHLKSSASRLRRSPSKKVVLLGMMTRIPVAGVVWQTAHYLLGLERLGYEAYYVETHARTPAMLMEREEDDSSARAAAFVDGVMRRFGLRDRWAFYALHDDNRCFGMSRTQLRRLYGDALCMINLHGGTEPRPELYETDRLVYLETDPVQLQTELHYGLQASFDFLEPHCAFFTYAENHGNPDCGLPAQDRFPFHPTRQPVVMDFWRGHGSPGAQMTTVGNWRQPWRDIELDGERYSWSKHDEFLKFIDLPAHTAQPFELALSSYEPQDKEMLEGKGWGVRHALDFSTDTDAYRDYIANSRGEFTVAKDQNVRLRTGWFSDRSITYLAAGRPVISQDTGFSNIFPTGEGLFGFSSMDEILAAVEAINSDYGRHSRAAEEIAREYFAHDVVLGRLLEDVGGDLCGGKGYPVRRHGADPFPAGLDLEPVSRRPTRLAPETEAHLAARPVPARTSQPWPGCTPVSIVMTSHDNLLFTRMCIESVLACTEYPAYELIVVDNGSSDGTPEYLGELAACNAHVRLALNSRNAGFARACNQGAVLAAGEVLVLLNDDTLVTRGWLPRLIAPLRDPQIGLAGAVTNRIGNEAEIPASYRTWGELLEFAGERARTHAGAVRDIPTTTMFCLAMRKETFERIGPLDQRFGVGMLEDDDYSRRARGAGYRLVCAEDAFVHHFGETSFGKLVPTGRYGEILEENKRRFEEKWGEPWQPYQRRPDPDYEALRDRIRQVVADAIPAEATVLVVSKGDVELLRLGGRRTRHFPEAEDGTWAGHHPADSSEAVATLEAMRAAGGEFIVFPRTGMWWLEHYEGLQEHLERRYDAVVRDEDVCVIFALNGDDR